jgi:hypothetical protein
VRPLLEDLLRDEGPPVVIQLKHRPC